MINKNSLITIFCMILISMPFIFGINSVQKQLNRIKIEARLTDTDPVENAPPIVAFTTIALGSFRGLIADILWLRAVSLQEKGQYFEMVQLASWMTKLQPRFTGATAFLAWNMAYNISVTFSSPEDRWRWVQRGIELIRDEALDYNPGDPLLYKELGWIYQHKIGNVLDDSHLYYKNQMAIELMKVFGAADPDWGFLASSPADKMELQKVFPSGDSLWKAIEESGYDSFDKLEEQFRILGKLPPKVEELIKDQSKIKILDSYFRKSWMLSKFKLDPRKILVINKKYGKFDWRLPEAHAVYWAELGIEHDRSGEVNIQCERMITQSLKDAFMGGRLIIVDKENFKSFMTVPNLNITDTVIKAYQDAYERQDSKSFRDALKNFMKDVIVVLYNFGRYSKAQKYLDYFKKDFPEEAGASGSLDLFVLKEWTEDVKDASMQQAMDIVGGLIFRSCFFLVYGEHEAAVSHERLARFVYYRYKLSRKDWVRTGLPEYSKIKDEMTQNCLKNFPKPLAENLKWALEEEKNIKH